MHVKLSNRRDFKKKQELIGFHFTRTEYLTITESKELLQELITKVMYAESNELISSFLRQNGMDEAQIETAIVQLNKLRDK
jgi:hypothetical protein